MPSVTEIAAARTSQLALDYERSTADSVRREATRDLERQRVAEPFPLAPPVEVALAQLERLELLRPEELAAAVPAPQSAAVVAASR